MDMDVDFWSTFFSSGYGDRREIQSLPKNSEKEALEWVGEHGFNQVSTTI